MSMKLNSHHIPVRTSPLSSRFKSRLVFHSSSPWKTLTPESPQPSRGKMWDLVDLVADVRAREAARRRASSARLRVTGRGPQQVPKSARYALHFPLLQLSERERETPAFSFFTRSSRSVSGHTRRFRGSWIPF